MHCIELYIEQHSFIRREEPALTSQQLASYSSILVELHTSNLRETFRTNPTTSNLSSPRIYLYISLYTLELYQLQHHAQTILRYFGVMMFASLGFHLVSILLV